MSLITKKNNETPESQILTFVNMADLMRFKGVGAEFAELLQAAGVDTIKDFIAQAVLQILPLPTSKS
ncbi:MAG: DUF4332 domain-containing protein [Bacteroidales bacterium]|jgi:predicted flap endonuclease-1-like 5' DNA nuclease